VTDATLSSMDDDVALLLGPLLAPKPRWVIKPYGRRLPGWQEAAATAPFHGCLPVSGGPDMTAFGTQARHRSCAVHAECRLAGRVLNTLLFVRFGDHAAGLRLISRLTPSCLRLISTGKDSRSHRQAHAV